MSKLIIAIVILLLVVMASPVGKAIAGALRGAVGNLTTTTGNAQDAADNAISNIDWNVTN